jgi:RNA polymerase sigma factor (sigma-70 family)
MSRNDNQSDVTSWLDNAGRYPLLSAERVNMIAKQIQSLPEDSHKRRKLVNTLVQHNLRLVARFAHGFMNNCSHNKWGSPETVDYLQTGTLGLVRAAEMFDPTRGYTFATYANFWIRSFIGRYNMKTLTPVYVSESASRQLAFYKRNGFVSDRKDRPEMSKERVKELTRLTQAAYSCTSLNSLNEYGHELIDSIPDQNQSPDLEAFANEINDAMDQAGISPIGQKVLLSYAVHNKTLKRISEQLGISISRVRSEKDRALRLARACPEAFGRGKLCEQHSP